MTAQQLVDEVAHNLLINDKLEAYPTWPPPSVDRILKRAILAAAAILSLRALDILARINLCRTVALRRRRYQCEICDQTVRVYNSCGERHCPTCSGGVRADWLERTAQTLIPQTEYLQLVFTIPHKLSELFLAGPAVTYNLLMQIAWRELKKLVEGLGIQASALIVLHTWNQHLGPHLHVHVLIAVGGVSLDGTRWIDVGQHPSLTRGNQWELGRKFRAAICRRLMRLQAKGELQLAGKFAHLSDPVVMKEWLASLAPRGYRVFVQHPPTHSTDPQIVLKYLARYVSGGPISNRRLVSWEGGQVTFMARSKEDALPGQAKEKVAVTISEVEFVRRWSLHILPKGFTRVRHYGMSANRHRKAYLKKCCELRGINDEPSNNVTIDPAQDQVQDQVQDQDGVQDGVVHVQVQERVGQDEVVQPQNGAEQVEAIQRRDRCDVDGDDVGRAIPSHFCPKCGQEMLCIEFSDRPSWRVTMNSEYRPEWYT